MPRGLADKTVALMVACEAILDDIAPTTVRGVAYQLFVRKLIPDTGNLSTKMVSRILTTARERGQIPWGSIVDDTRAVEHRAGWDDPADYMDTVKGSYRKDWWADQPERLLVISEKGTVGGILRPVLHEYGVDFLVLHGFGSATALRNLARKSANDARPLTLLYVGDHDPSGRYMSDVDIPQRLEKYGGEADLDRLAVTTDQMWFHDLPTFPATEKRKDARYRWFVKAHGETCCELDALDPNILRKYVKDAITDRIDDELWERAKTVERAEMRSISDFLGTWKAMMSP